MNLCLCVCLFFQKPFIRSTSDLAVLLFGTWVCAVHFWKLVCQSAMPACCLHCITIRGKWMLHQWLYENVWVGWDVASCTVVMVFVLSLLFPCLCFPPSCPCAVCFCDPLCFALFLFMSYFASRFISIDPFLIIPAWILLPAFINSYIFLFFICDPRTMKRSHV